MLVRIGAFLSLFSFDHLHLGTQVFLRITTDIGDVAQSGSSYSLPILSALIPVQHHSHFHYPAQCCLLHCQGHDCRRTKDSSRPRSMSFRGYGYHIDFNFDLCVSDGRRFHPLCRFHHHRLLRQHPGWNFCLHGSPTSASLRQPGPHQRSSYDRMSRR